MNGNDLRTIADGIRKRTEEPAVGALLTPRVYASFTMRRLAEILDQIAEDQS